MDLKYHNRFESIHMATNSNRFKLDSHLNTLESLDSVLNLNRFILLSYWNIGKDELALRIRRSTFWRQSTIEYLQNRYLQNIFKISNNRSTRFKNINFSLVHPRSFENIDRESRLSRVLNFEYCSKWLRRVTTLYIIQIRSDSDCFRFHR